MQLFALDTSFNNCIQLSTLRLTTISNTVMCAIHDFFSSKVRFIYTSTVTGLHSCSRKKLHVRLAYILFLCIFILSRCTLYCYALCKINMPRHATPRHATPRHATPRHATPRHATPRHATPRDATPHHTTRYHTMGRDCTSYMTAPWG